jgi:hypothetical protein
MPRNWDPTQTINSSTGNVEWPQGTMTFEDVGGGAVVPRFLEAWVLQNDTGAIQRTTQRSGWASGRWNANDFPPGCRSGNFQEGPAVGIALAAWHNNATNEDKFEWWVDRIYLY